MSEENITSAVPKKRSPLLFTIGGMMVIVLLGLGTALNPQFWSQKIIPPTLRGRFLVNADIIPAAKEERAMFVSVNPNFRAQFGDKNDPTAAYLRLAVVDGVNENKLSNEVSLNPFTNSSEVISALGNQDISGIELTLFSASITGVDVNSNHSELDADEELISLAKELLGEDMTETAAVLEVSETVRKKEEIITQTLALRENNQDLIRNLAVATDVDVDYLIEAGRGITSQIVIGNREHFDTACLSALSQGVSELCDLPRNRFSFLLALDPTLQLQKSLVSLDSGTAGSYYIADGNGDFLLRLANPLISDATGATAPVEFILEPATVNGEEAPGYYILTIQADLSWLTSSKRVFPAIITSGFYLDHQDLLLTSQAP